MEDIKIPLSRGTIADLADDADLNSSQGSFSGDSSSQMGSKEIYDKEAKIKVNYNRMDVELKEVWLFFFCFVFSFYFFILFDP